MKGKRKKSKKKNKKKRKNREKRKMRGSPDRLVMNLWVGLNPLTKNKRGFMDELVGRRKCNLREKAVSGALGRNATSRLSKPN